LTNYFLKRFLLIIPTFLGITFITFFILQIVPGGPLETEMLKLRYGNVSGGIESGSATTSNYSGTFIPQAALDEMKRFYGLDKPMLERYFIWLKDIVTLDFGKSYTFNTPVIKVISERFPITLFFGLISFILTYLICIPLGVYKAVKKGSVFDYTSSVLIFIIYTIPGWTFGILLLILFGGGSLFDILPLGGFTSQDFSSMSFFEKIFDILTHSFLPLISYTVGSIAALTILTRNSVLENMSRDYVKALLAKGLTYKKVLWKHILRNSLIPLVTGFGHFLSLIVTGSFLIESVFNLQGIGLLGYSSVMNRDYPVSLGILVISSLLLLIGNIITDFLYAYLDPRIRYK
jgi:microcin C transport system permease protein